MPRGCQWDSYEVQVMKTLENIQRSTRPLSGGMPPLRKNKYEALKGEKPLETSSGRIECRTSPFGLASRSVASDALPSSSSPLAVVAGIRTASPVPSLPWAPPTRASAAKAATASRKAGEHRAPAFKRSSLNALAMRRHCLPAGGCPLLVATPS